MVKPPISTPAGFAPAFAIGFADAQDKLTTVTETEPLPVMVANAASAPPALTGQSSVPALAGPFTATPGLPVTVALSGTWTGTAQLLRSINGGTTKLPLRVGGSIWGTFSEPGVEQVWVDNEAGVSFYLDLIPASGTINYRVSQ